MNLNEECAYRMTAKLTFYSREFALSVIDVSPARIIFGRPSLNAWLSHEQISRTFKRC
jgi:hypothetical protein